MSLPGTTRACPWRQLKIHTESWALRLVLLATTAYQALSGNQDGAVVAGEGFVVSLAPLAIARLSQTPVPRPLELAFVFGMALQFLSESTKLFELLYYWDKIVHPTLIALTGMIAAWLLLGYAEAFRKRVPVHVGAAFGILLASTIGVSWEFVEFTTDWFGNSDLQKSNADTMSDLMSNCIGAYVATLLALWLYTHVIPSDERREMGAIGRWAAHGPRMLLRNYGRLLGTVAATALVTVISLAIWVDQNIPAVASGLPAGTSQAWHFSPDVLPADAQALSGDWVPDPRGVCRENLENPKPGSEKMGVLQLASGSVYGISGQPFRVQIHYFEERPPISHGTEMDAGIAFGIRDASNFDLLEENALHDNLRLDHFIHGKRRDLREKLFRTHGDEWHWLQVDVAGSSVTASIDGMTMYTVDNVPDTDGGIGLWARAAGATCFSDAVVSTLTGS